mgnify:CR=1 FL=1
MSLIREKIYGALIGSGLGDAIGELAFKFGEREELLRRVDNRERVIYTDDTAMALGITEIITLTKDNWTTEDLGEQFHLNYVKEPYRGYGMGPPQIFSIVEKTNKSYNEVAQGLFGGEGSYGNGASMRIAPLGVFYYDTEGIYDIARKAAVATHTHPLGVDGAAALAKLLSLMVPKDPSKYDVEEHRIDLITQLIEFVRTSKYNKQLSAVKELLENDESFPHAERELGSNVLAYTSVPFSIFAFLKRPHSFKECLLDTILISSDRDTVGAMVGGLLGAYLGFSQIPKEWVKKLENLSYFKQLAGNLYKLKQ